MASRPRHRRTSAWSRCTSARQGTEAGDRMLELKDIGAGYGAFQALFGITMQVNAGEAVAVIGANGAGKTTLMRVISGMLPASTGTMTMEGADLRATPAHGIVELGIAHV